MTLRALLRAGRAFVQRWREPRVDRTPPAAWSGLGPDYAAHIRARLDRMARPQSRSWVMRWKDQ